MKLHNTRGGQPKGEVGRFYRNALACLQEAGFRFLICGGYAMEFYTGVPRRTKDIDIFVLPEDVEPMLEKLRGCGYRTEISERGWLAKAHSGEDFIDIIHNSGNGLCPVDESWFDHGAPTKFLDLSVLVAPPEEMIWQKAYIMVRHRFDGADVMHLLHACGERLDWRRLLDRFGDNWRVLFSHLVLFEYVYPGKKSVVPGEVMRELTRRLAEEEQATPNGDAALCRGTLLSKFDFQADITDMEYQDARAPLFQD